MKDFVLFSSTTIDNISSCCSIYSKLDIFDSEKNQTRKFFFEYDRLLEGNFIDLNTFMHKRELYEELGGFDEKLKRLVDWDLALRYTKKNPPIYLPLVLTKYNLDDSLNNITNTIPYAPNYNTLINKHLINWEAIKNKKDYVKNKVSIVIPVFNCIELTVSCLRSIQQHTDSSVIDVIVVDNGSTDNTEETLIKLQDELAWLHYTRNQNNYGFAVGCNIGASYAENEFVLFLNNDTLVTDGWLDILVDELRSTMYTGMVGPKLLYSDDTVQFAGFVFNKMSKIPYHIYRSYESTHKCVNHRRTFQAITGACFIMRTKDFFDIDGFDPQFVNGGEDLDLCFKVTKKLGKQIVYQPESIVFHLEGKTEGRSKMIMQNRTLFVDRWRNEIVSDDEEYLKDDGFEVTDYEKPGTEEHGDYAAYYPKVVSSKEVKKEKKISVGFIAMWYQRGITYHALQLIKALDPNIYEVHVFSRWESDKFNNTGDVHLKNVINAGDDPSPDDIVKWVEDNEIAVLIPMEVHPKDWKRLQAIKERTKCHLMIYENLDVMYRESIDKYEIADSFLVNTYYAYNFWKQNYPNKNVLYIPWGIETNISNQKKIKTIDAPVFLHIAGWGGLNNRKNTGLLIRAFNKVKGDAKLKIYMQCSLDTLDDEVRQILLSDTRIDLYQGTVDDIYSVYSTADVLLWPSKREGLGLPIVEALAHGLPVVISDGFMMKEWINDREYGLIVDSKDVPDVRVLPEQDVSVQDLIGKISSLITDKNLLNVLKENVACNKKLWQWNWQKKSLSIELKRVIHDEYSNIDEYIPTWRNELYKTDIVID